MPPMLFDTLEAGQDLGTHPVMVAPLIADWMAAGGASPRDGVLPAGLVVSVMMRGYIALTAGRPPGNVHAGQVLRWGRGAPCDGELTVRLRCADKALRNDRRWLTFTATVLGAGGEPHLEGEMTLLWSA